MSCSKKEASARILRAIREMDVGRVTLMEVCGTHTMAIAKSGIRSLLPKNIELLSGPGCPVCVTPAAEIDAVLEFAMRPDVILATYGDMLRVPGSTPGDSLQRRRALGAQVEIVYSPVDAVQLAEVRREKQVVFLGVGFETTAPGTAAAILTAKARGVKNFTVWSLLKAVEPSLRALIQTEGFAVQGFLCPGHVASILGTEGFRFLPEEYGLAAAVSGFEPEDILTAVYRLLCQLRDGKPQIENGYRRAVSETGNALAKNMLRECFERKSALWRGLGEIEASGYAIREELAELDACRRFEIVRARTEAPTACRCGEVITGQRRARECSLFGTRCTPEDPVGPCMVSSEGACAAAYKYQEF